MVEKLKPSVRASGGTPSGFPDFRPINKLPRHELRTLARRIVQPALYQVWVEDRVSGKMIAVGPRFSQQAADTLAFAIADQIRQGHERIWANPCVSVALAVRN